jgi:hypothetical protein
METWHWDEAQEKAFITLKTHMCLALVLMQPDFSKMFYVQMGALGYGMGAVLS